MSSLFKSKTKTVQNPFESNPWEAQQDYLKEGFDKSTTALNNGLNTSGGITDYTADLNAGQLGSLNSLTEFGNGAAQDVASTFTSQGNATVGDLSRSSTEANAYMDLANTDRTGQIIDRATQYAENPYMQSMIDGAISDVNKGFQRDQGGINSAASGTGNINSSRAGVMEALALDDAMDRSGSISSTMRGNAYENGLNRSFMQDSQGMAERLSGIGALSQTGAVGADMLTAGLNTSQGGYNTALGAQSMLQAQAQAEIEGKRTQSREELDLVQQYMKSVGGNYGSQGFQSQTTQSASPFQQITGVASSLMGAF